MFNMIVFFALFDYQLPFFYPVQDVCTKLLFVEHKVPNAAPDQLMAKNLDTGEFCRADLIHHSSLYGK